MRTISGAVRRTRFIVFSISFFCISSFSNAWAKDSMSPDLMQAFQHARHQLEQTDNGDYLARNPGNQQRHEFNAGGFVTTSVNKDADWQWGLKLTGYGSADNMQVVEQATRHADGPRIEYRRGKITEWYENLPIGLEQGFTLNEAPVDNANQLIIEMTIQGDLQARWLKERQSLAFHDNNGSYALTYHKLVAFDADQQELPAHMVLADNTLQIHVDASGASWPIVVDPLVVNEQKVHAQASDAANSDFFGAAVALSSDTALIGMYKDDDGFDGSGSALVFVRTGTAWSLQQKLTASDAFTNDRFGFAVSLSGDIALIGADSNDDAGTDSGSAYIFTRSGGIWTEQQKLTASDAAGGDNFGISVVLDGDTALIGARTDDDTFNDSGSAYVFERNIAAVACVETASVDPWCQQQKLNASDPNAGDYFGIAVALSGDTALVGALFHNDTFNDSGSAYVYTRIGSTWTQQQKLNASDPGLSDYFGVSVALSGDSALVGAYRDDSEMGSAYVFTRSGVAWTQQQKLIGAGTGSGDRFGWWVALDGDGALIGASRYTDNILRNGSAFLFTRSGGTWTQTQQFTATDATAQDEYGSGVALDGDTILVGSPFDDDVELSSGSVYVYTAKNNARWRRQAKLLAVKPGGAADDNFGSAVAVSGNTALISARFDDDNGSNSGSVWVFARYGSSWGLQQKLTAGDGAADDEFGNSVSVFKDTALVGSWRDDDSFGGSGSAYVFIRSGNTWSQQQKLTAGDPGLGDRFGKSVSLFGDTALVGAWKDDDKGNDSGSAYVFTRSGGSWTEEQKLTASDGAALAWFGGAVSLFGETALVGAERESGSAYVFTRSGGSWTEEQKLTASDGAEFEFFGIAASLSGDTALMGAELDASAYVFTRSGGIWTQQQKLTASNGNAGSKFGAAVSVSGDIAVIGAYRGSGNGGVTGVAYLYTRIGDTWTEQLKLVPADNTVNDKLGISVAVSGNTALVGAEGDDDSFSESGSAYFFTFPTDTVFKDGFE